MKPKAIIKIPIRKKKSKNGTVKREKDSSYPTTLERLTYCMLPRKEGPESEVERDIPDRVLWIEGDLGGLGYATRDPEMMASALDFGHDTDPGRKTRGLVVSCQEIKNADTETRTLVFDCIRNAIPDLVAELGVTRWIAIAHDDRHHPHVHIIFTNWNEVSGRRLDIRPSHLKALQSMDFTEFLESGRGSREGLESTPTSKRERELQNCRRGNTPLQTKLAAEKEAPILALQEFLNKEKAPMMATPQDLADHLYSFPALPDTWDTSKLKTKKGEPRENPAIIIDGVGLKLRRFFEFIAREHLRKRTVPRKVGQPQKGSSGPLQEI